MIAIIINGKILKTEYLQACKSFKGYVPFLSE